MYKLESVTCPICKEDVTEDEWLYTWDDEPAHGKCIVDESDFICRKNCGYMSNSEGDCEWCESEPILLTFQRRKRN